MAGASAFRERARPVSNRNGSVSLSSCLCGACQAELGQNAKCAFCLPPPQPLKKMPATPSRRCVYQALLCDHRNNPTRPTPALCTARLPFLSSVRCAGGCCCKRVELGGCLLAATAGGQEAGKLQRVVRSAGSCTWDSAVLAAVPAGGAFTQDVCATPPTKLQVCSTDPLHAPLYHSRHGSKNDSAGGFGARDTCRHTPRGAVGFPKRATSPVPSQSYVLQLHHHHQQRHGARTLLRRNAQSMQAPPWSPVDDDASRRWLLLQVADSDGSSPWL